MKSNLCDLKNVDFKDLDSYKEFWNRYNKITIGPWFHLRFYLLVGQSPGLIFALDYSNFDLAFERKFLFAFRLEGKYSW